MSWDEKGWHEFDKKTGGKYKCAVCDHPKEKHLSKVDYVAHRLLHGKTKLTSWDDLNAITNAFIAKNMFKTSPIFPKLRQMGMSTMTDRMLYAKLRKP